MDKENTIIMINMKIINNKRIKKEIHNTQLTQ
jgi:hypothetical protein